MRALPSPPWALALIAVALVGPGLTGCSKPQRQQAPTNADAITPGVRVEAAQAVIAVLPAQSRVVGQIAPWRVAAVVSSIPGTIRKRAVDSGQTVTDGQPLFWLDASRLLLGVDNAKVAVASRTSERAYAEQERSRLKALQSKGAATTFQLDQANQALARARIGEDQAAIQLRSAKRQLADATLTAPHSGVIHRVGVDVGDAVGPGVPLAEVVDLSRLRIRAGVRAQVALRLEPGVKIPFVVDALDGAKREATLATIAPRADPRTGLFDLELHAENPEHKIKGGMSALFDVSAARSEAVVIPAAALTRRQSQVGAFRLEQQAGATVARFVPVVTGHRSGGWIEVTSGVAAKDKVATTGLNALADGARVLVTKTVTTGPDTPSAERKATP